MINFATKEIIKLMKENKYQGVIWVLVSEDNLEDSDYELFETWELIKNMSKAEMNKAAVEYKKEFKNEIGIDGLEGLNFKISKFKIEKNEINSPALDLKISSNMFNINWDMEIYAYLKNNKPILHREINKNIQSKRLALHLHCPSCMDKLGHHDPGYPPTFHSELTTKGIEINSIQCGQPDCRGVIKQFQDKLIPFTSDKEKYEKIEPNQNLFKETLESQMEHKGGIADNMHSNTPFRSKSTDIPDDKHQREY